MLEQAIDELMTFAKRHKVRVVFAINGNVYHHDGGTVTIDGKPALLAAMREDSERERHKRGRECHRSLLRSIVELKGIGMVPHRNDLAECIDASERCLREQDDET